MAVAACQRGVHAEDEGYECSMGDLAPSAGEALVRGSGCATVLARKVRNTLSGRAVSSMASTAGVCCNVCSVRCVALCRG